VTAGVAEPVRKTLTPDKPESAPSKIPSPLVSL